jgi:hypothetical protein
MGGGSPRAAYSEKNLANVRRLSLFDLPSSRSARLTSVFCSISCALAEPVAGLAAAKRLMLRPCVQETAGASGAPRMTTHRYYQVLPGPRLLRALGDDGRLPPPPAFREGDKVNEKLLKTPIRAAVALNMSSASDG